MNTEGKVPFLSPKQLKRAIIVLWKAQIPAAIFGGPGCGKTTAVYEIIDDLNIDPKANGKYKMWPMILSYKGPEDVGGVPYPNSKHTRVHYLLPEDLPFDTEEPGIIFGDEFDRASPETQNSFLQILLGGNIHGKKISPNAYVTLAMNGTSDIYTTQLSTAAITRVCTLFVSSGADEFLDSYDEWAELKGISPMMRGFARFTPDLLEEHEDFEELARATPRTRDMADRILMAADAVKFKTEDIIKPMIAGVIGKAAAVKLLAFRHMFLKAPEPLKVIKDPEHAPIPDEVSVLYALICALVAHVKNCDDIYTTDQLCRYAVRLPDEMTGMMFRKLHAKCDKVVTNSLFDKWAKDHSFILELSAI